LREKLVRKDRADLAKTGLEKFVSMGVQKILKAQKEAGPLLSSEARLRRVVVTAFSQVRRG
jgi:hypothetical protein